jgi:hypothetical protein
MFAETIGALADKSTLMDYMASRGAFRTRVLPWWNGIILKECPYRMGQHAVFAAKVFDPTRIMHGGHFGAYPGFRPPDTLREAFGEAYKIVNRSGRWLSFTVNDERQAVLAEYDIKLAVWRLVIEPQRVQGWENWLAENAPEFEKIHGLLDLAGVEAEDRFLHPQGPLWIANEEAAHA